MDTNLMNFDDVIEQDGETFVLLPEGDYNFLVTSVERARFPGGPKIPPCIKAVVTIQITTKEGLANIKFDLLLYRTVEWKLSSFFRCIGQKKHGEKLTMDWSKVVTSVGRCHVKQRKYTNQFGEEKVINDVEKFYDDDPAFFVNDDPSLPF